MNLKKEAETAITYTWAVTGMKATYDRTNAIRDQRTEESNVGT